jgi:hypothetical protein
VALLSLEGSDMPNRLNGFWRRIASVRSKAKADVVDQSSRRCDSDVFGKGACKGLSSEKHISRSSTYGVAWVA